MQPSKVKDLELRESSNCRKFAACGAGVFFLFFSPSRDLPPQQLDVGCDAE